jgi:hypothetical protein
MGIHSDMMLGAPYASPGDKKDSGQVVVIFGRTKKQKWPSAIRTSSLRGHGFVINGARAVDKGPKSGRNDMAGWALGRHVGDVNGDMIK